LSEHRTPAGNKCQQLMSLLLIGIKIEKKMRYIVEKYIKKESLKNQGMHRE
jgi:hypothetical protein